MIRSAGGISHFLHRWDECTVVHSAGCDQKQIMSGGRCLALNIDEKVPEVEGLRVRDKY